MSNRDYFFFYILKTGLANQNFKYNDCTTTKNEKRIRSRENLFNTVKPVSFVPISFLFFTK